MGNLAIDQQHRMVDFHRDAHREVECGEGLSLAGQRARDHHQRAIPGAGSRRATRIAQYRPFDDAELICNLRLRRIRRHVAERFQPLEIDFDPRPCRARRRGRQGSSSGSTPVLRWPLQRGARIVRSGVERAHHRFRRGDALTILAGNVLSDERRLFVGQRSGAPQLFEPLRGLLD